MTGADTGTPDNMSSAEVATPLEGPQGRGRYPLRRGNTTGHETHTKFWVVLPLMGGCPVRAGPRSPVHPSEAVANGNQPRHQTEGTIMAYIQKRRATHKRRTEKREQAAARNTARQNRSDTEQLAALEARGAGNCDEARLLRLTMDLADMASG